MLRELGILIVTFVGVTAIAYALGAANTATAATFGEIAFAGVLVGLLIRR